MDSHFIELLKTYPLQRSEPLPVPAPPLQPEHRPLGERRALVTMRRGELSDKVQAELSQLALEPLTCRDFSALVDDGYATRDGSFHRLTQQGIYAADWVIAAFAKQLGIHHFTCHDRGRYSYSMRCTCGCSWSHSKAEGHWLAAQMRIQTKHLKNVEAMRAEATGNSPPLVPELPQSPTEP